MKVYELKKRRYAEDSKPVSGIYVTELGLRMAGSTIYNRGRSLSTSEAGKEISKKLAEGAKVRDPYDDRICWEAVCLGEDFSYCRGRQFVTSEQLASLQLAARSLQQERRARGI